MFTLTLTTIATSAADSLNPIAIAQQFVLQGLVKKPVHIWYFISSTAITNYIGGMLAYFGLAEIIRMFFSSTYLRHSKIFSVVGMALGCALIIAAIAVVIKSVKKKRNSENEPKTENDETKIASKIKSVAPSSLFVLGMAATIAELTTALPYFAFLSVLVQQEISLAAVMIILLIYNFIYSSPLMLLYFIYKKAQKKFDKIYFVFKTHIKKMAAVATPAMLALMGGYVIFSCFNN